MTEKITRIFGSIMIMFLGVARGFGGVVLIIQGPKLIEDTDCTRSREQYVSCHFDNKTLLRGTTRRYQICVLTSESCGQYEAKI